MAEVIKSVISSDGQEKDLLTAVINRILALDSNFVCDTTVDAQFASMGSTPTFGFTTSTYPGFELRLTRATNLGSNTNTYNFYIVINSETKATSSATFAASSVYYANNAHRAFFTNSVVDTGLLFIWFGNYNVTTVASTRVVGACITDSNNYTYYGGYNSYNIESASFYKSGDASVAYTISSGLPFIAESGYLEYIKYVIFISSGQEVFRLTNLVNSTQLTAGSSVSINEGIYYAIGPHTLIALD